MTGCDADLKEGKEKGGKDGCITQERNKHAKIRLRGKGLSKGHAEVLS